MDSLRGSPSFPGWSGEPVGFHAYQLQTQAFLACKTDVFLDNIDGESPGVLDPGMFHG